MNNRLADAIRRATRMAPGSLRELAKDAGIHHSLLNRIISGDKGASVETAAKLEAALRAWSDRAGKGAALIQKAITARKED